MWALVCALVVVTALTFLTYWLIKHGSRGAEIATVIAVPVGVIAAVAAVIALRPEGAKRLAETSPHGHPVFAAPEFARVTPGGEETYEWYPEPGRHPEELSERQALAAAYANEIGLACDYLKGGLSILVRCDKLLVPDLAAVIAARSGLPYWQIRTLAASDPPGPGMETPDGRRLAHLMSSLRTVMSAAPAGEVVVISQFDLLADGDGAAPGSGVNEFIDLLYENSRCIILAFAAPSYAISDVAASRFAVQLGVGTLPMHVPGADGTLVPIGQALVTRAEAELFDGFDAYLLYGQVAGMNAVQLRRRLSFAYYRYNGSAGNSRPGFADLLLELRLFGARASSLFELPAARMHDIGGYGEVKEELLRELSLLTNPAEPGDGLPVSFRRELTPRGFILDGPPGTGKSLFAMAIANMLAAMITVISAEKIASGKPGEPERKLRSLFEEARRKAPAVLVLDDIESIAATGRPDGAGHQHNSVVAELIDQLDSIDPRVPVLVIGTTSRLDRVDSRLLKPGRLRPVRIDLPDDAARRQIAELHARQLGVVMNEELLDLLVDRTKGMTGEDIRSFFRDAWADERLGIRMDTERLQEIVTMLQRTRRQHRT